jgi:membrane associated rhomboid family serine protease
MAFLLPHAARQPIFRAPMVVLLLIAVLVLAHVARTLVTPELSLAWINQFAFIPARYSPAFLSRHGVDPGTWLEQAVPFVSYMGLHDDYTHVAINSLWLLAFGPIVARRFGATLFLLFFVLCGIAGAVTHLAFNWGSPEPVIGASAAISGLMAAGLRLLPTVRPAGMPLPGGHGLLPILSQTIVIFTLIWVGINIVVGLAGLGFADAGQIAWQAHLGGYAAGLFLCGLFDRFRPLPVGEPL